MTVRSTGASDRADLQKRYVYTALEARGVAPANAKPARLGQRFDDQHARQDRAVWEVPLEERLIRTDELLCHHVCVGDFEHAIDKQDRVAMRQQAPNLFYAQRWFHDPISLLRSSSR